MSRLEELEKAFDDAYADYDDTYDACGDTYDAAYDAYYKASQELEAYKKGAWAMSTLEELQKAVEDAYDDGDAAYAAWDAAKDAALDAHNKARRELKDYKKEHGL